MIVQVLPKLSSHDMHQRELESLISRLKPQTVPSCSPHHTNTSSTAAADTQPPAPKKGLMNRVKSSASKYDQDSYPILLCAVCDSLIAVIHKYYALKIK